MTTGSSSISPAHRKALRRREALTSPDLRFITFSCYRRLPLLGDIDEGDAIKRRLVDAIVKARLRHGFALFAWVIMPEHVHVLNRPRAGQSWAPIASAIKNPVARAALAHVRANNTALREQITDAAGRERFWQPGGGFDRNIRDLAEFTKAVRYIHRNPVERGLVERAETWEFSSVRWWMGRRDGEVPCDPPPEKRDWSAWTGYM